MRIVIDTNIIVSGLFFGGLPRKILDMIVDYEIEAFASPEIIDEYERVIVHFLSRNNGVNDSGILLSILNRLLIIDPVSNVDVCRDIDDNKFINCAIDADALYLVSGDNDLLVLKKYRNVQIITAKEFIELMQ